MDPRKNPYAPGAGTKPPALVGRDEQVESFDILLERLERGYAEQSMIITGLRGVGKTVLLDVFREKAEDREWATIEWEVEKNAPFAPKMAAHVRRALAADRAQSQVDRPAPQSCVSAQVVHRHVQS